MKTLRLILILALCSGCATRKAAEPPSIPKSTPPLSALETPEVRAAEIVKAYPVGRYTDPHFPEAMHERHTLYRREQAAEWNYRPSKSYALPLGPVVAESNPSPSYYVKTNAEQMNAQQKAYAEALLEQNRALNQRIQDLQKQDSTIQGLQEEIERLKKERDAQPRTERSAEKASPRTDTRNAGRFFRAGWRPAARGGQHIRSGRSNPLPALRGGLRGVPHFSNAPQFRTVPTTRCHRSAEVGAPAHRLSFSAQLHTQHTHTMNQIKLSLRAADDSRTIKEEGGVPTFATVFSLHNAARRGRDETIPITVKASHELALTLVRDLRKGTAFVVEGQLSYFKHPDTNRESYSIWADNFTDITAPKSKPQSDHE